MAGTVSVFFDESGQERRYRPDTKYYLLTLVLHNQKDPISGLVESYERSLSESSLPNVPFHAYDLYHRRGGYAGLDFGTRKKLFAKFSGLVRRLPVTYTTFKYRRSEFEDAKALSERMERDLVAFVEEHLEELQSFDTVAIYYDGGQNAVRSAIRNAFDETLSVNTAEYKSLRYQDRRLAQAADYCCSIELAALRYADHDETETYDHLHYPAGRARERVYSPNLSGKHTKIEKRMRSRSEPRRVAQARLVENGQCPLVVPSAPDREGQGNKKASHITG